jgi:hypothetical protein
LNQLYFDSFFYVLFLFIYFALGFELRAFPGEAGALPLEPHSHHALSFQNEILLHVWKSVFV